MAADRTDPAEPLRLGAVFGRYRVDALVGRGGMGVVFRATDLTLDRPVALKVLSSDLAADPSFRARFVRESRLAAAIEHPAIVPVYEAGVIGDTLYIAMRFVPGRDLGSILRLEAPLDLGRTLALVRPIAEALDAAHRRGLVHRDVKPANILVEHDGTERPFLADFGLTRRLGEGTVTTRSGPLGTIDYVAPEQVQGGPIDGRVDQYGLACVVVHCLTGAPPFSGDSDASVLFAHVHAEPPRIARSDDPVGASVDAAVTRALAKSPADRFADCRSFVLALGGEATAPSRSPTPPDGRGLLRTTLASGGGRPPRRHRRRLLAVVTALTGAGIVVGALALAALPPQAPPASPPPTVDGDDRPSAVALRPTTGEVIYFASDADGDSDIYAIEAGRDEPRKLTRTERDERQPAVSPDGTTIAFVIGNSPSRDIWLMDADGENARPLVTHRADDTDPAWSADGRSLAFASRRRDPVFDVYEIRDRGGGLDERDARNITGRPAVEELPAWAPTGRRLMISSNHHGWRDLFIIDATDPEVFLRRTTGLAYDLSPSYHPDGELIAFDRRGVCESCLGGRGQADLFVIDLRSGRERRLTETPSRDEVHPDWSPDGRALVFASGRPGRKDLFVVTPDGAAARRLTRGLEDANQPDWAILPRESAPSPAVSGGALPGTS